MNVISNGSSVTRSLSLDANVIITEVFGTNLSDWRSEYCAALCTAFFLPQMHSANRVDVIACDPHPICPPLPQHCSGGVPPVLQFWLQQRDRVLSCHIISPQQTLTFWFSHPLFTESFSFYFLAPECHATIRITNNNQLCAHYCEI